MTKQHFLSKDFFVDASETETRQTIMTIPHFVNNIKFVNQNAITTSLRFLYERPADDLHHHIDVSVLPLTNNQARVMLHVAYADGHSFQKDNVIVNALQNFELAVHAALENALSSYTQQELKVSTTKKIFKNISLLTASVGILLLSKKIA